MTHIIHYRHLTRGIWPLVWPIMLSNISVPLLGLVDTAILGHLPSATYLGAVAVGGSILTLLFWSFGFLRMGTTSLVARAVGRGDYDESVQLWLRSAALALTLALGLWLLQRWLIPIGLNWMEPEPEAAALAASYCHIRFLSAPATLINYTLIGWFIGQQDTRRPLVMLVATNAINIALDILLVLKLGLHSDGAAWASVIAEYSGAVVGLALLAHKITSLPLSVRWPQRLQALGRAGEYLPLLQVNRHLFVRTLCLLGVFTFFTAQGARLGTTIVAANAILLQFLTLTAHALDGYAHAAEALCGRATGSQNRAEFYRVVQGTSVLALLTAIAISIAFWLGQPLWLSFFTAIPAVLAEASQEYIWVIILPLVAIWAYQMDGIFLGSGQTRAMQYAMLGCTLLVFLPLWSLTRELGNTGLWLAFVVFNASRGVVLGALLWYRR